MTDPQPKGAAGDETLAGTDERLIRGLAALLAETDLTEIEIERGGFRVRVSRAGGMAVATLPAPAAMAPQPALAPGQKSGPAHGELAHLQGAVTSPMVGTVYVAPSPGAAPFVRVGDSVSEGQTVLIVEAMKTMNPITAPRSGRVTRILIADAQPVEFGEVLMIIE